MTATVVLVRPRASGGLAAHVDQELQELTRAGHDVREARARIGERPRPLADLRAVRALHRSFSTAPVPSAVHAHGLRAGALSALAMPRGREQRLVVTLHNRTVGSLLARGVGAALLRVLARRADTVLAVSPDLAEDARRAGARDVRHAVIPAPTRVPTGGTAPGGARPGDAPPGDSPPVDAPPGGAPPLDETAGSGGEQDPAPAEPLDVLVIARLAEQKGLHDLLSAAALLREGSPVRIRVAGDGPLESELRDRIRAERLPVQLLGRRDDIPGLLAATDLVVSAARWEGQPVALQEALRAGRAIVATDAGGTRWVTGSAARLVPVGDAPALASAIAEHRDVQLRERAEQASRRRARELPTAGDMIDQLGDVLALNQGRW
ncbi:MULTISPECIES: glycosyltransferase [unclassified Brachybacterium]|uniref:glycosyltransferase n=1 Tax=unclassified Brachybacterium TaxID=2623841 RepID=UPI003613C7D0